MKFLNQYWGVNENISPSEIFVRAVVMFLVALLLIRVSGMWPFGKDDPFDTVIAFLIGGILVRGIIGATPFFSTISGTIAILIVHKILSKLSFYSKAFGKVVKGRNYILYKNGEYNIENMKKTNITKDDIFEELRLEY